MSHEFACVIHVYEYIDCFGGMIRNSWGSLLDWGAAACVVIDIGVTLAFVCQFLALLIVHRCVSLDS